jgi:hypothetical protein
VPSELAAPGSALAGGGQAMSRDQEVLVQEWNPLHVVDECPQLGEHLPLPGVTEKDAKSARKARASLNCFAFLHSLGR